MIHKKVIKNTFQVLNIDYVRLGNKWNFSNVISPYYRLYYIDGGEGRISSQEGCVTLEPGFLYLIPSFTLCNLFCKQFLSQYFVQFFEESANGISLFANSRKIFKTEASNNDVANFKRMISINPGRGILCSYDPFVYEKDYYYKEQAELNSKQSLSILYETQGILLQLLSKFLKPKALNNNNISVIPPIVMDAIAYIQTNLQTGLKVSLLADRANLNIDYFSRIFNRHTGQSPINYILQQRIERAQYLIITTGKLQEEIAEMTGFENVQYFSRVFKRLTGVAPGVYRKTHRNNGE